mgnify:CR=1 FL=1
MDDHVSVINSDNFIASLTIVDGVTEYKGSKIYVEKNYNYYLVYICSKSDIVIMNNYSYEQTKSCFDAIIDIDPLSYSIIINGNKYFISIYLITHKELNICYYNNKENCFLTFPYSGLIHDILIEIKSLLTTLSKTKSSIGELFDECLSIMGCDIRKNNKILDDYINDNGTKFVINGMIIDILKYHNYFTIRKYPTIIALPYACPDNIVEECIDLIKDNDLMYYDLDHVVILINFDYVYFNIIIDEGNLRKYMIYDYNGGSIRDLLIKIKSVLSSINPNSIHDPELFSNFTRLMNSRTKSAAK